MVDTVTDILAKMISRAVLRLRLLRGGELKPKISVRSDSHGRIETGKNLLMQK